jgi:proline dehydrogenase
VKAVTEWGIRQTFFKQFVGGESVVECEDVMQEMRERGVGTLLVHSVEVDESGPSSSSAAVGSEHGTRVVNVQELEETLRAIDEAASFERKMEQQTGSGSGGMWLAVKIVSLGGPLYYPLFNWNST